MSLDTWTAWLAYPGMLLILGAFMLETRDRLDSRSRTYLGMMALGSGLLTVRAFVASEWAFLLLEVAWMAAAIVGLLRPSPARASPATPV